MNLLTQETPLKFTKVSDWQIALLNGFPRNGKRVFNKNNVVMLHPATDMKGEFEIKYQYLGAKAAPEEEKKEATKEVEVKKEPLIEDLEAHHAEEIKPVVEDKLAEDNGAASLDAKVGGAIDKILDTNLEGLQEHAKALFNNLKRQKGESMYIDFELAVPVDETSVADQTAELVKQQLIANITKMGFDPEIYKITVNQVEESTLMGIAIKIYRVQMSSKQRVRVLRFKVSQADIEDLRKSAKSVYDMMKVFGEDTANSILQYIVTHVQKNLKDSGFVIANVVKSEDGNYIFTAVQNLQVADEEDKDRENDNVADKGKWDFAVDDKKNDDVKINNVVAKNDSKVDLVKGGFYRCNRWRGCHYHYPSLWRRWYRSNWGLYGGNDEKVPVDVDAKISIEYSSNLSAFSVKATNVPVALDVIIESESEYAKLLEEKRLNLMVVKFYRDQDVLDKSYAPLAFDTSAVEFDAEKKISVKRVTAEGNSEDVMYVFYLFVKDDNLKDFDKEPEAVKEKLSMKLRMSVVTTAETIPV